MLRFFKDHWNVYVSCPVHGTIMTLMRLQVSNSCGWLSFGLPLWLGSIQFSDLEARYPDFRTIYETHIHDAKFDKALRRDSHFESWKLRLISVRHLDELQALQPQSRAELSQFLLKGDFEQAQLRLMAQDTKWPIGGLLRAVVTLFSPSRRPSSARESLKQKMKILSSGVSDSQFLFDMKSMQNQDLQPMIQQVEEIAHTLLASLIDETAQSMTCAVSEMQKERCLISIQRDFKSEERRLLDDALTRFIQQINTQSAGQRDS